VSGSSIRVKNGRKSGGGSSSSGATVGYVEPSNSPKHDQSEPKLVIVVPTGIPSEVVTA
jgi:hypothetical protein